MTRDKAKRGYVHIYTGSGKGKTTAALGLGLRAACAGLRVCIFQFLKAKGTSCEDRSTVPNLEFVCLNEKHPLFAGKRGGDSAVRKRLAKKIRADIAKVRTAIKSGQYDLIVLDEIVNCVSEGFLSEAAVIDIIAKKPRALELVLTGRGATDGLIGATDYVTEIDKVKHPFDMGLAARRGIEY